MIWTLRFAPWWDLLSPHMLLENTVIIGSHVDFFMCLPCSIHFIIEWQWDFWIRKTFFPQWSSGRSTNFFKYIYSGVIYPILQLRFRDSINVCSMHALLTSVIVYNIFLCFINTWLISYECNIRCGMRKLLPISSSSLPYSSSARIITKLLS